MAVRLQVLDQGGNGLETTVIGADGNVIDRNVSINGLEGKLDELVAAVK